MHWSELERGWRILATGLGFSLFGLGGLALRLLVFPLFGLQRCPERRALWAKTALRYSFLSFIHLLRLLGVLSFELHGRQHLARRGLLILSNHPSLLDVVFLMAWVKNVDCVIKARLWHNPFMRGPIQACRFILNDDGPSLIDRCQASLDAGNNLIIFPEGTRTPRDGQLRFQRGVAHLCLRAPRRLTPISIRVQPPMLLKHEAWYRVPPKKPHFRFEVLPDIDSQQWLMPGQEPSLASRKLTERLQTFFTGELARHG